MAWKIDDVDKHYKGLTAAEKTQWVAIANSALAACEKDGKDNCDASAITQANGVLSKKKKQEAHIEAAELVVEAGRMISAANSSTLSKALKAMQDAMAQVATLLADDSDKPAQESHIHVPVDGASVPSSAPKWMYQWSAVEAAKILAQNDSYDSKRYAVQQALRQRAMADMATKKLASISDGGSYIEDDYYYSYSCMPHIRDLYDDAVVYSYEKELYQCDYSVAADGVVTLGDATGVRVSYVPDSNVGATEANTIPLGGELVELRERAVADDGTVKIKLISPGWGSSGYYSAEVLKRDGPKVFTKGQHMYVNHPTAEEDINRPERDLRDLAGVLEEDAIYDEKGATGPGLYATAKVFDTFSKFIDEAAPYIGTSIRASGRAVEGDADGRHGMIVEGLVDGYSVDYVTLPGRGGEVLPLLEAARARTTTTPSIAEVAHDARREQPKIETKESIVDITKEELDSLKEAAAKSAAMETQFSATVTELARLREGMILRDAQAIVTSVLAGIQLPDMTRARLAEACAKNPPVKTVEGSTESILDVEKLTEATKNAAIEEMKYIASVTTSSGRPVEVGESTPMTDEDADKILKEAFTDLGMSEKAVNIAVGGRN